MVTQEKIALLLNENGPVIIEHCGPQAVFITIGNWTVYLDNGTGERIVDSFDTHTKEALPVLLMDLED